MFSNLIKFVFILTGYSPILLIYWIVGVYNSKCYLTNIFIVPTFLGLILLCWYILKLAKTKLTVNEIQLKSLKPADNNFMPFILSYFLPCVELYKKDFIFICIWLLLLFLVVLINKNSNHYNPILKFLFGYRYYEVQTTKDVTYTLLTQKKLINKTQINRFSQLTDYVILDQTLKK